MAEKTTFTGNIRKVATRNGYVNEYSGLMTISGISFPYRLQLNISATEFASIAATRPNDLTRHFNLNVSNLPTEVLPLDGKVRSAFMDIATQLVIEFAAYREVRAADEVTVFGKLSPKQTTH